MNENENQLLEESRSSESGELSVRNNKTINLIAKIGAVVLAFIIWYFAADSGTVTFEKKLSSIPIEIRGESSFSVLSGDGATIDAVVSGKRSIISGLKSSDIKAYVNVSGVTSAGECSLKVSFESPQGVSLEVTGDETILLYMDNTVEKTVPVDVEVVHFMLKDGYSIGYSDIVTDKQYVVITGPQTALSDVERARLYADLGNLYATSNLRYSGTIVPVDAEGNEVKSSYMTVDGSTVIATIPVYKTVAVPASVKFKHGILNESNCSISFDIPSVKITGAEDKVDAISGFTFTVDDSKITEKTSIVFDIELPPDVKSTDGVQKITVTVEPLLPKSVEVISETPDIYGPDVTA